MAHMVETMAYANEVPWHGLGTKVDGNLSPSEMMKAAKLDWNVNLVPATALIDGKNVPIGRSALVRDSDNSILTVVSDDWKPVQNHEAFDFFSEFVREGHMTMETAGSLSDGQRVWALAKINESFDLFNGRDVVESYMLFTNPHIYGSSGDVRHTPIRVVCNNTITLALRGISDLQVNWSHRRAFDAEKVKTLLKISSSQLKEYKEAAQKLCTSFFNEEQKSNYIKTLFPVTTGNSDSKKQFSKTGQTVLDNLDLQPGAEYGEGTFWQLFNGVTYTIDHLVGKTDSSRMHSAWYGGGRNKKTEALNLALEMA